MRQSPQKFVNRIHLRRKRTHAKVLDARLRNQDSLLHGPLNATPTIVHSAEFALLPNHQRPLVLVEAGTYPLIDHRLISTNPLKLSVIPIPSPHTGLLADRTSIPFVSGIDVKSRSASLIGGQLSHIRV